MHRSCCLALLLAASIPAAAPAQQRFPLMPLRDADSAFMEGGYSCFVGRGNRNLFLMDVGAGVIRYGPRLVRLSRANARIPFNPNNLRGLAATGGSRSESYSVSFARRRGRAQEGHGSFSQPVRMTVTRRAAGRSQSHSLDTTLTCAS